MRAKYTFRTTGHLFLAASYRFAYHGRQYELNADSTGFLASISVIVAIDPLKHLPTIALSRRSGVKADLRVPAEPQLAAIREELRNVEGLLSLYGVREIATNEVATEWIPETPEEKGMVKLINFSVSRGSVRDRPHTPVPFDIVARSILMAASTGLAEVPLSFYRKGCIDIEDMRYIDAIYDFYFVLETLYSGGKTKNAAVKDEFLRSPDVLSAIGATLPTVNQIPRVTPEERAYIAEHYAGKLPQDIVEHFVSLRGFLHHHAPGHPRAWHPEGHDRYRIDAFIIQEVAYNICMAMFVEIAMSPQSESEYFTITELETVRRHPPFEES